MSHAVDKPTAKSTGLTAKVWDCLCDRLGLDAVLALGIKKRVPIHRSTIFYYLGGMAMFLFGVQIVSGILLSLYYKPSPDQAFESVQAIMTEVKFGWLVRSVHSWGANLAIGVLFLHMLTAYMMRAYRRPREITWITGVALLGLFMAFGFSGYLLPWNKLAFFATRVGTALAGNVPLIGEQLLLLARGGENVTGDTLSRFYALHVAVFPLLAMGLLGVHLYLVQRQGMSVPQQVADAHGGEAKVPSMSFVPDFLLRDAVGWYLAVGILAALAALFPWELGEKADPFAEAPKGIAPEWYFLFMFQALKQLHGHVLGMEGQMAGVLFFGFGGLLVLLVPFLDVGERSRRVMNCMAAPWVVFIIVMTAWGWFPIDEKPTDMSVEAYGQVVNQLIRFRIIMGTSLGLGMLALCDRFMKPAAGPRRLLGIVAASGALLLIAVIIWELLV